MVGSREGCSVALVALALGAMPAWADQPARSSIAVTAQVATITRIEGLEQPAVVTISHDDAARGYVTALATLKVRSNAVAGYVLTLWPCAAWFESVRIAGAGTSAELSGDGGALVLPAPASAVDEVSLELTFRLRDGMPGGDYAWPVEFAVSPL